VHDLQQQPGGRNSTTAVEMLQRHNCIYNRWSSSIKTRGWHDTRRFCQSTWNSFGGIKAVTGDQHYRLVKGMTSVHALIEVVQSRHLR